MIKEDFLHYIWQYKLFFNHDLKTTDNEPIEIIDVGRRNTNAGPDFFNAKVKIGDTMWSGNVEIHVQSSDWAHHKHTEDENYQSVILHVVDRANMEIKRKSGEKISQLEIKYPAYLIENYAGLTDKNRPIRCASDIQSVPDIFIVSWMNSLLSERLLRKTGHINSLLEKNKNNWEEAFYVVLARSFGFGLNSDPFERLANALPLHCLQKHKNNLLQLEALFYGQAGLLPAESSDEYVQNLISEYSFLKSKFNLHPLENAGWKFMRLRPVNFPYIRIAQFAALIHQSTKLFSRIIENVDYKYISSLFSVYPSTYWETHYTFNNESEKRTKKPGNKTIDILLINTIIPFLFCYGEKTGNEDLQEKALKLLEKIPAEKNKIVDEWDALGIKAQNASDSQALIQLRNNYCNDKKCLQCRIGHKVLTKNEK